MTTKTKKIIFWAVLVLVAVGLFLLLVNKAPWLCIGFAFGWAGKYVYDRIAKRE